jgi:hypothetical protein
MDPAHAESGRFMGRLKMSEIPYSLQCGVALPPEEERH